MAKSVGYIGLGLMGKSIAANILKAGFQLVVHNRSQGSVDELVVVGRFCRRFTGRGCRTGRYRLYQSARFIRMSKRSPWGRMASSKGPMKV